MGGLSKIKRERRRMRKLSTLIDNFIDKEGNPIRIFSGPNKMTMYECDGRFHRLDGPALIKPLENEQRWYRHGELHNPGGPAIRPISGKGRTEYWAHGQYVGYIRHALEFNSFTEDEIIKLLIRQDSGYNKNKKAIHHALKTLGWSDRKIAEIKKTMAFSELLER